MTSNRRLFIVLIGWAGFCAFFAAWLLFHWGGTAVTQRFDNIAETLAAFLAAAVCGIAAWRHQRRTRIAWALIGASALSWGLGQSVWSYYELVKGQQVPFPSLADLGYLGAVPLAVAGVLFFPSASARHLLAQDHPGRRPDRWLALHHQLGDRAGHGLPCRLRQSRGAADRARLPSRRHRHRHHRADPGIEGASRRPAAFPFAGWRAHRQPAVRQLVRVSHHDQRVWTRQ